jgi:Ser/Thr protein kinase RdoA (MazF antagonist)
MHDQLAKTLRQFGLSAELDQLPGGSQPTFRAGHAVLKRIKETSLENNHSPQLIQWIADFTSQLGMRNFRLPQPIATTDGRWITDDGWTAWTFLDGQHATTRDIPDCIAGITALHQALHAIPKHPLMDDNRTPWGKAHQWCWGLPPPVVPPQLQPLVHQLYALCQPIQPSPAQLIHGDLNPENILIAPGQHPAFLDFSPFWAPKEFALAIFANWIGPRCGDSTVLEQFGHIPNFAQLLIRAALRMLLVIVVIDELDDWETSSEKRAAELVIEYMTSSA